MTASPRVPATPRASAHTAVNAGWLAVLVVAANDAAPAWTFVDGGGPNGLAPSEQVDAGRVQLTAFDGKLYAAWREIAGGPAQLRVVVGRF